MSLWIVSNQALMGCEWIVGTFEAKTVAYVCFLGALPRDQPEADPARAGAARPHRQLPSRGRHVVRVGRRASRCSPCPRRGSPTLKWCWLGRHLRRTRASSARSPPSGPPPPAVQRFVVLEAIPYHTDPFFGGKTLAYGQVALHVRHARGDARVQPVGLPAVGRRDLIQRFFVVFQIAAAVPFAIAFIARAFHVWDYLRLMPLRSFPLIVPLVFFFQAVRRRVAAIQGQAAGRRRRRRVRRRGYVALVAIRRARGVPHRAAARRRRG